MRNLKRALSLALASVMLLGMMVVGTSAASYPDVDENDNVEAIEVLNAVNVMIGRQGNFEPDEAVNRHEMAVIMAKLVLGVETADNYVGTHPFTDVVSWADKYVAACYENGLIAGTSATTYGGGQPLTAVQAAAMMLRALGYKDLSKGATDWRAPVTAMANQIRLFNGVASNPSEKLNRNQVAQLALNTLKSPMVNLKDNTISITDGNGNVVISGGDRDYIVLSSREAYAYAINDVESSGTSASMISGATVELGEHLYGGKLRLNSTTDVFQRPARHWEYDGKAIGTYVKEELLRATYTTEVTGKMLYDLLTKNTIEKYGFTIAIDGVDTDDVSSMTGYFTKGNLVSTNTRGVGATGKGVLTEVYVDSVNEQVYIAVMNTYLAKAAEKYNEKRDEVKLNVWGLEQKSSPKFLNKETSKNPAKTFSLTVTSEDFGESMKDVAKNDILLVRVADNAIQEIIQPEVIDKTVLSSFSKGSWVNNGTKYDYANTARYDDKVLDEYSKPNMKELTYNLYLDQYGYMIGIERNEDPDEYVFLAGIDAGSSNLKASTADANVIHVDGTMKTVKVDLNKSKNAADKGLLDGNTKNLSQLNTWCKYTVSNSGVYTLTEVGYGTGADKLGQFAQDVNANNGLTPNTAGYYDTVKGQKAITEKRTSLVASADADNKITSWVYGNDDTKYINVELKGVVVKDNTNGGKPTGADDINYRFIVDDVDTVITGIKDVDLLITNRKAVDKNPGGSAKYINPAAEIYTLYKEGIVIAAVTIGEDMGSAATWAYITSEEPRQEDYYHETDSAKTAKPGEWTWYREAVVDGKLVDLIEVNDGDLQWIGEDDMKQGEWYEVKLDADGNVRKSQTLEEALKDRYLKESLNVEETVDTKNGDVVLHMLFDRDDYTGKEKLTFKNGNLYTNSDDTKGFSVSKDVKVVLGQAQLVSGAKEGDGDKDYGDHGREKYVKQWKYKDDTYESYEGLKSALDRLDANFVGDLNVIFHNGAATVIVINDIWGEYIDEGNHTGNGRTYNLDLREELRNSRYNIVDVFTESDDDAVDGVAYGTSMRYAIRSGDEVTIYRYNMRGIEIEPFGVKYTSGKDYISFIMPSRNVTIRGYEPDTLKDGDFKGAVGDDVGNLKVTFNDEYAGVNLGGLKAGSKITILIEESDGRSVDTLTSGKEYVVKLTIGSNEYEYIAKCEKKTLTVVHTLVSGDIKDKAVNTIEVTSVTEKAVLSSDVDKNGAASAEVKKDDVSADIANADAKNPTVTIDVSKGSDGEAITDATSATVTLDKGTVDAIKENENVTETAIKTPVGTVTLPADTVATIAAAAENEDDEIKIDVAVVDNDAAAENVKDEDEAEAIAAAAQVVEITVTVNGEEVLAENVGVKDTSVKYTFTDVEARETYYVVHIDDKGATKVVGKGKADSKGELTVTLPHLSQYALVADAAAGAFKGQLDVTMTVKVDAGITAVKVGEKALEKDATAGTYTLTAKEDADVTLTFEFGTGYEIDTYTLDGKAVTKGTDGYSFKAVNGGEVVVTTKNPTAEAKATAADGTVTYGTFAELVAAADDGAKIVLQNDVTISSGKIEIGKAMSIDLAGKKITGSPASGTKYAITVSAEVTISNTKKTGGIEITSGGMTVAQGGDLTLDGVTVKSGYYLFVGTANPENKTPARLYVKDSSITTTNTSGIGTNGTDGAVNEIIIDNSSVIGEKGKANGMLLTSDCKVEVKNNSLVQGDYGIAIKSGNLTITDSTVEGYGAKYRAITTGDGDDYEGPAIVIDNHSGYPGGVSIEITDSELKAGDAPVISECGTEGSKNVKAISITGGTLTSTGKDRPAIELCLTDSKNVTYDGTSYNGKTMTDEMVSTRETLTSPKENG